MIIEKIRHYFSLRAFARGMAVILAIYALLAVFIILQQDSFREKQQARMPSLTVLIDGVDIPIDPPPEVTTSTEREEAPPPEIAARQPEESPSVDQQQSLPEAPLAGLYERTANGILPVIRTSDGMSAFEAYRRPYQARAGRPYIALAIDGYGLSRTASESALRTMPSSISLILSPYAEETDLWVAEARARGHEIWLKLPTETDNYPLEDPGMDTLLVNVAESENIQKLLNVLGGATGYAGVVSDHSSVFMRTGADFRPPAGMIFSRGLGMIDGNTSRNQTLASMASGHNMPYGTVDLWLDMDHQAQADILENLARLEQIAKERGYAIGIIRPLPVSYQTVLEWLDGLPAKGLDLAPLSAVGALP